MAENIYLLEQRICALERNLLGERGSEDKVFAVMGEAHATLENFSNNRERFKQIFKRVPAIEDYLRPGFADKISHDTECEKQFILAVGADIERMSKQLEEINLLSRALDSERISEVTEHSEKVKNLALVQAEQIARVMTLTPQLADLLNSYNRTTAALSEIFIKLDWDLSQIEDKNKT